MIEHWRPIPGFTKYEASNMGNVRLRGTIRNRSLNCLADGYVRIKLQNDFGKYLTISIHRLISLTFLGQPNGLQVNHKNFIRHDNRVENLEYLTAAENNRYSRDANRYPSLKGRKRQKYRRTKPLKLNKEQVIEILMSKERVYDLCKKFNVSGTTIELIKRNKYPSQR